MYEAFFNLRENPFGTTPDPRFLYKSKAHREALAYVAYGVFRKKGFRLEKSTNEAAMGMNLPRD